MPQTFLSAAEVDELVSLYAQGMPLTQLGERFGVYHRTVTAHIVRRSIPMASSSVLMMFANMRSTGEA